MNMSKESKNETNPNTNYKGGLYKETRVKKMHQMPVLIFHSVHCFTNTNSHTKLAVYVKCSQTEQNRRESDKIQNSYPLVIN